jgi:hypothetical protein
VDDHIAPPFAPSPAPSINQHQRHTGDSDPTDDSSISPNHHQPLKWSEDEWKTKLTPEEFAVLREGQTEDAGVGKYCAHDGIGTYICAGCGIALYESASKFDYACGWPAFHDNRAGAVNRVDVSKGSGTALSFEQDLHLCMQLVPMPARLK